MLLHPGFYKLIRLISVGLFLLAQAGCAYESQTITGKVVDDSGNPLDTVTVLACYSGWGWSTDHIVWDKSYCSEPVSTNAAGNYVINFAGPEGMTLYAKKDSWVQTQSFNSSNPLITLISSEKYAALNRSQRESLETTFRQRRAGESDTEYYCRVVTSRVRSMSIKYRGKSVLITPALLGSTDSAGVLFALEGSSDSAASLAREVQVVFDGEPVSIDSSLRAAEKMCEADILFIQITGLNLKSVPEGRIEMIIPSIHAGWDMEFWNL